MILDTGLAKVRKTENIGIYKKNVDNLSEKKPPGKS